MAARAESKQATGASARVSGNGQEGASRGSAVLPGTGRPRDARPEVQGSAGDHRRRLEDGARRRRPESAVLQGRTAVPGQRHGRRAPHCRGNAQGGFPRGVHRVDGGPNPARAKQMVRSQPRHLLDTAAEVGRSRACMPTNIGNQLGLAYEKSGQLDKAGAAYPACAQAQSGQRAREGRASSASTPCVGVQQKNPEHQTTWTSKSPKILQQPKAERNWIEDRRATDRTWPKNASWKVPRSICSGRS